MTYLRLKRVVRRFKRLVRVVRGRELWIRPQTSASLTRMGNDGAAWCVDLTSLSPEAVVYSVGVGEDISFDLELIRAAGVNVFAFDPTPRTRDWLRRQSVPPQFKFFDWGLGGSDREVAFFPPANPAHVSHSLIDRGSGDAIRVKLKRVSTIARELGHGHIDLLKLDIEGAEYEVIADLIATGMRPTQLLIEFHHRWTEIGVEKTANAIAQLQSAGYLVGWVSETGEEYTFILGMR